MNWNRIAALCRPGKAQTVKPEALWDERCLKISGIDVRMAAVVRSEWYQVVRKLFERFDYLVLPSAQVFPFSVETHWPAEIAGKKMDMYHRWMEVMIPVTMSGCPAIGVPVGFSAHGLPMGMQIVAPMRSEQSLLQIGECLRSGDAVGHEADAADLARGGGAVARAPSSFFSCHARPCAGHLA